MASIIDTRSSVRLSEVRDLRDQAQDASEAAEAAAGIVSRATSVAGLTDPATLSEGDQGMVSGSGNSATDGIYEVQSSAWVKVGELSNSFKADLDALLRSAWARSGILWGVPDGNGWFKALMDDEGRFLFDGYDLATLPSKVDAKLEASYLFLTGMERSGLVAGFSDPAGRFCFRIEDDKTGWIYDHKILTSEETEQIEADVLALTARMDAVERASVPSWSLLTLGDSLTEGVGTTNAGVSNYGAQVRGLYGGTISVSNRGIGGQSSAQIAGRAGFETVRVSISGNQIPASGTVAVSGLSPNIIFYAGSTTSVTVRIAGVLGVLNGSGFTRSEAGDPVDTLDVELVHPDIANLNRRIVGYWLGQNDGWSANDGTALLDRYKRMRAKGVPTGQHYYYILGLIQGVGNESGTSSHDNKAAFNTACANEFPGNFIPINEILIEHGLTWAGITPTAQDETDIANGIVPSSLRKTGDGIHLNEAGYGVVARAVKAFIDVKVAAGEWELFALAA